MHQRHRQVIQPSAPQKPSSFLRQPPRPPRNGLWARPEPVSEINLHNRRCQGVVRRSFHGTSARLCPRLHRRPATPPPGQCLTATICYRVFTETASGAWTDRPTQEQLLDQEQPCPAGSFDSPPPPDWSPRPRRRSSSSPIWLLQVEPGDHGSVVRGRLQLGQGCGVGGDALDPLQLIRDQFAASWPVIGSPAGILGARFHSRLPSPKSGWLNPPVPSWEPGGPSRIWVVAAWGCR